MKKIIFILFGILLMTSLVNAFDFDNIKNYNKETKTVEIRNSILGIPFLELDKVSEITLTHNTYSCFNDCSAEGIIKLYEKSKLIDKVNFKNLKKKKDQELEYKIFIKKDFDEEIPYLNCSYNEIVYPNGSLGNIEKCNYDFKIIKSFNWVEYDNRKLEEGTYNWRIEGKKNAYDTIDWIGIFQGVDVTDWAVWKGEINLFTPANNSYITAGEINFTGNTSSEDYISNISLYVNGVLNYTKLVSAPDQVIDPVNVTYTSCISSALTKGMKFVANNNTNLVSIQLDSNTTQTNGSLLDSGQTVLAEGTFVGDTISISYALTEGTTYYFVSQGTKWCYIDISGLPDKAYPWPYEAVNWTAGFQGGGDAATDAFNVVNITTNTGSNFNNATINVTIPSSNFDYGITHNWTIKAGDNGSQVGVGGIYYFTLDRNPNITIETPTNLTNSTNKYLDVNYTANDEGGLNNCWYSNDTYLSNTSLVDCRTNLTSIVWSEGKHNVTIWANDTLGNINFSSVTFNIDSINPYINITSPANSVGFIKLNNNLTIAWNVTDFNLIDSCFGSFDNWTTNFSLVCLDNNLSINITSINNNSFYIWANDSFGNSIFNYSIWTYSLIENTQVYNTTTYETSRETFFLNVTFDGSETLSANFYYDGISRGSAVKEEYVGGEVTFVKNIDIALTNETQNKTFFFSVTKGSENINTTKINQTVKNISLSTCNNIVSNYSLNFTLFDESTNLKINSTEIPTDYEASFNYWIGQGEIYKNYSYSLLNTNTTSNYSFCIDPNILMKTNLVSTYTAYGYSNREYNLNNASISNVTSNIMLYLLNSSDSIKFTTTTKYGVSELPNAYITISKFFIGEGNYKTVSIRKTDNLGKFIEYLDLDKDYKYSVVYLGELLGYEDRRATCLSAPCEQTIQIGADSSNVWTAYNNTFAANVVSNLSFNRTSELVTYSFVDVTGLANYFRLEVYQVRFNETQNLVCNNYSYSSAGTIYCNLSGQDGDFLAKTYISRSPEKIDQVLSIVINDIVQNLGMMGIFFCIIIIITMVIIGAAISSGNPSVMLIFFGLSILILKLMMLFPFSWGIVSLLELLVIVLIAKLGT